MWKLTNSHSIPNFSLVNYRKDNAIITKIKKDKTFLILSFWLENWRVIIFLNNFFFFVGYYFWPTHFLLFFALFLIVWNYIFQIIIYILYENNLNFVFWKKKNLNNKCKKYTNFFFVIFVFFISGPHSD